MSKSTALRTDRYELTMLDAALRSGQASKRAVFELFTRSLPKDRGYGVVAGTTRALDAIHDFTFGEQELTWLSDNEVVSPEALEYLSGYRFTGDVWGYREGDLYGGDSPILTVESSFAEAVLLETVLLSIFNHDSAVSSAVARMVDVADGRAVIEGGARRGHEYGSVDAARAAYIAGANATSNLEAGRAYGIPTVGTIGHAFVLAHQSEAEAFDAQHELLGSDTTYLVDTYDIEGGIRAAVAVAGPDLGAIRIDSGDLSIESANARTLLDGLGATDTRIIVSGDLDEWSIRDLATAPIDGYLVGTNLITGSGHPTASMVYKLVAIEVDGQLHSVNKRSSGKGTTGGRKAAFRMADHDLLIVNNKISPEDVAAPGDGRRLQVRLVDNGERLTPASLDEARAWRSECVAALSENARSLNGVPQTTVLQPEGS